MLQETTALYGVSEPTLYRLLRQRRLPRSVDRADRAVPPALSPADKIAARALLKDPAITVEEVAHRLRVSPATLYRHFPGGRSGLDAALR